MEVVPGVYAIEKLSMGRSYLYAEADRLTLIDTGVAGKAERIFEAIEEIGRRPEDLRQIVVTHYHLDHVGSLADVVARTNAQVLAHVLDAPVVRGEQPAAGPNPRGVWRLLAFLPKLLMNNRVAPSRVDRELNDGDEIDLDGGAKVVHVPGHTPGSIAVHLPRRKLLFAGDAAGNALGLGPPSGPLGMFNEDHAQADASFRKLAQLDFDVACFGHGKPLDKDASQAFRRAAEKP
jgi:glyoxylase-like metal-dependent hydrolase (beta-lactamase superfamily II)